MSILGQECGTLTDTGLSHFRNANLGFVFQSFHLIPTLDVAANIELPLTYRRGRGLGAGAGALSRSRSALR